MDHLSQYIIFVHLCVCFFFTDTATTEIYTYGHTLSLHDALPIWLRRLLNQVTQWLPGKDNFPLYREASEQKAADYEEAIGALAGQSPGMVRLDRQGRLVRSVAVPVQRYRQVLGALMLSKDGTVMDADVDDRSRDLILVCGVDFEVTL